MIFRAFDVFNKLQEIVSGMAYALLAQLAPVNGLYTSFFPVLVYALFGTTKHLSVGTFAIIALMVAEAISKVCIHTMMSIKAFC